MVLKKKLTSEEFENLDEGLKVVYLKDGDNYILDVEKDDSKPPKNDDDVAALRRALDREREDRKKYKQDLDDLKKQLDDNDLLTAKKKADIETLEKAWNDKLNTQKGDYEQRLSKTNQFIKKNLIEVNTNNIAEKLAGKNASLLKPHIEKRLTVDFDSDDPMLRVLSESGELSANSLTDLEKEFLDNEKYSAIIVGSKASGSGATGQNSGGGAATAKNFDDYSPSELKILRDKNPEKYEQLKAARKSKPLRV